LKKTVEKTKMFLSFFGNYYIANNWRMDSMGDIEKTIGNNAGRLYEILNEYGPQVQTKLLEKMQVTEDELFGAIGWLARENKVKRDTRRYKVGETNLTETIGTNAGKVWHALQKRNDIDVTTIARLAKISKRDCYSALGWLAREDKISAKVAVRKK
jgi:hypothetical protein